MVQKAPAKVVFLVWAPYSIRAENIADSLGAKLLLIHWKFKKKIYFPIKYPLLFFRTVRQLSKEKPSIVICQSPPIFSGLSALFYKYISRNHNVKIVIDAHTASFCNPWSALRFVDKHMMKRALVVLVTNQKIAKFASTYYQIQPLVLEDKIPSFKDMKIGIEQQSRFNLGQGNSNDRKEEFKIGVITSFAPDEPIAEILESAASLPGIKFYITGSKERFGSVLPVKGFHDNIIFTGMVDRKTYVSLLEQMDCIMVLTKRDGTLLAGASEALALGKPLITSIWVPLQDYYSMGTLHIDNSPKQICEAIIRVRGEKIALSQQMQTLRMLRSQEWQEKFLKFTLILQGC